MTTAMRAAPSPISSRRTRSCRRSTSTPSSTSRLTAEVLARALDRLDEPPDASPPDVRVAGCVLEDRDLRTGLEAAYRELARHAPDEDARIRLVDLANEVRPRTWT